MTRTSTDFDFLVGSWDVEHHRLVKPLTGSDEWETVTGSTATARTYLDGACSIDEIAVPDRGWSGMSIRLYSPETGQWSIWWVASRDGRIGPPVHGRWENGSCRLIGEDQHEGTPVLVTYEWSGITADSARWQQAYSADGGETWETNWVMNFRRTSAEPVDVTDEHLPKLTGDYDFLTGTWKVRHRKLRSRLTGSTDWDEFENVFEARTHFNGGISIDEGAFPFPVDYRGLTVRTYDVEAEEWAIHWIDGRWIQMDETPLRGRFTGGVGEFLAEDVHDGTPILARIRWDVLSPTSVNWEQAFSTDGGKTWEPNWVMHQTRIG
jgi:BNR/Asp-box repeat protein